MDIHDLIGRGCKWPEAEMISLLVVNSFVDLQIFFFKFFKNFVLYTVLYSFVCQCSLNRNGSSYPKKSDIKMKSILKCVY